MKTLGKMLGEHDDFALLPITNRQYFCFGAHVGKALKKKRLKNKIINQVQGFLRRTTTTAFFASVTGSAPQPLKAAVQCVQ